MQNHKSWVVTTLLTLLVGTFWIGAGEAGQQGKAAARQATNTAVERPPTVQQRETWRKSMSRSKRPKKGCFTVTYPQTTWKEVPCVKPAAIPFGPNKGVRPFEVGNGTDFSAQVGGNTTAAEGSFDSVSGVTSENGGGTANKYSLQLNTNTFTTSTCSGAANPSACRGWEQFIYSSVTLKQVFIQYWLLGYNNTCPAGWTNGGGGGCFINSAGVSISTPEPISLLSQMTLSGDTTDQATLVVGGTMFSAPGDNHFPDLSSGWRISEFNIFGDSSGTPEATLNSGSTLVVRTRVNSGMPNTAPTCDSGGFTGERNNMTLSGTPTMEPDVNWPSIIFTQTNGTVTTASCATAESNGDTHVKTFDGLAYDFQASGDFLLTQAPNFQVQARQAVGPPQYPNTAVNKAIAVQMGSTRVALYIEPVRLIVDGKAENLADGKDLLLPTGVQISRRGILYNITSAAGDRVQAVLNPQWIDVTTGLGHTPSPQVRGLLGNPAGNARELKTVSGAILKEPVAFGDLYHSFADGWRVAANASLFSVASTIKASIPTQPFFAEHLNAQEAAKARAVCTAAHVAAGPLLEDCVLDNAVLKNEAATKVFIAAKPVRMFLKPVVLKQAVPVKVQ